MSNLARVARGSIYVTDSKFMRELIAELTPDPNEHVRYITGPDFMVGRTQYRVMSRIYSVEHAEHSPVYARATVRSCAQALCNMIEHGNQLQIMAHCHPGCGPCATRPSGIDKGYLGRVQASGADVIGVIVTRDGYARFFTINKSFRVFIRGLGVEKVGQHVYRIKMV